MMDSNILEMEMNEDHKALMILTRKLFEIEQRVGELERFIKTQPKIFHQGDKIPTFLENNGE